MTEYIKAHTKLPPYDPLPRFIWEMDLSNTSIIIYSLLEPASYCYGLLSALLECLAIYRYVLLLV